MIGYRQENMTVQVNPLVESTVRALNAISPQNQELVAVLVRQLAEREGVNMEMDPGLGLKTPAEGIPLWIAKLKQETYSKRTIELYEMTVVNYLRHDLMPSKLSIQKWLADRMERVSTAKASNDRKALRSLFKFLYSEGLWPIDPTATLKHITVRYRAREMPPDESIEKLLRYQCHRPKDTPKFRTMTVLLITTGLRVTEGASILKRNINLEKGEIMVIGKGGKEGVVPLLPVTVSYLSRYMETSNHGDSPYLFPGDTEEGHWSIFSYEKTIKRACDKLGIKRITPHQLRHYFATVALRGGAKLEVVSRILRHASVGITADIYRHVLTDEMHETVREFAPLSQAPFPQLPEGEAVEVEGEFREVEE